MSNPAEPVALADPAGRVEYDDVGFAYPEGPDGDAGERVLEGVSLEAEPGETVALVGPTGAGKSTCAKLLLRLYGATEGAVRVDGHDVRELALAELRGSVGYVAQDTFLFDGAVAENVRYGRFDASMEEVEAAARAAEAHEFITELPEGYDTRVGERGVKLSSGQRQRLSIARVVLRDPSILVLDDGRVVERGDHEELLAADGLYAALWGVQAGELEALPESFRERARSATPPETD